jgi:hypothetical protein
MAFLDSAAKRETGTMTHDEKRRRLRGLAKQLRVLTGSQLEAEQAQLELDFTPAKGKPACQPEKARSR